MMILLANIILCLLTLSSANPTEDNDIRSIIPDMLKLLCPGSDVCRMDDTGEVFRDDSCCSECSCKETCTEDGTCCFQEDGFSTVNNDTVIRTATDRMKKRQEQGDECVYLSTGNIESNTQSVWMISQENEFSLNSNKSCGEVKVAPWGSVLPVSSKSTSKIYKNHVCAEAHNVTDGVVWKAVLVCPYMYFGSASSVQYDASQIIFALEADNLPFLCVVKFVLPSGIQVRKSDICYNDVVDECLSGQQMNIPDYLPMSPKNISDACVSGLYSPYRGLIVYSNVFCHMCNEGSIDLSAKCSGLGDIKFGGSLSMTMLVDDAFLRNLAKVKSQAVTEEKACIPDMPERCRPLLCPSGQLRNIAGRCAPSITSWISTKLKLNIKLKSDRLFRLTEYMPLNSVSVHDISALKLPTPNRWGLEEMHYKLLRDAKVVYETSDLLLVFEHKSFRIDFAREVKVVNKILSETWYLHHPNGTVLNLQPSLWEFQMLNPNILSTSLGNSSVENYMEFYVNGRRVFLEHIVLTKLSMCDMVELNEEEYRTKQGDLFLTNKINNRTLGNAEFSLVLAHGNKHVARVCAEDSGFTEIHRHSTAPKISFSPAKLVGIVITIVIVAIRKH